MERGDAPVQRSRGMCMAIIGQSMGVTCANVHWDGGGVWDVSHWTELTQTTILTLTQTISIPTLTQTTIPTLTQTI